MRVITLTKKQLADNGRYGNYFRISLRQGVKISNKSYSSVAFIQKNIKKNSNLQKIVKEATIGVLAESTSKGLVIVKLQGRFYLGILQTHVSEGWKKEVSEKDFSRLQRSLEKNQVVHGDLHSKNILWVKKKPVAIDFDPNLAYFVGEKSVYYTVKNRLMKSITNPGAK